MAPALSVKSGAAAASSPRNFALLLLLLLAPTAVVAFLSAPPPRAATSIRRDTLALGAKNVRFGDAGLDKLVQGINVVGNAVRVRVPS